MNYAIVNLEEKTLVGVSARTSNSDSNAGMIIGGLWNSFMTGGILDKIENKTGKYPISLYSDYEDNTVAGKGLVYDVTVGIEAGGNQDDSLTVKVIPSGKYAKFHVTGSVDMAVMQAWQKIWNLPLERKFTGDFEVYLNDSMDNAEIDIYVALK